MEFPNNKKINMVLEAKELKTIKSFQCQIVFICYIRHKFAVYLKNGKYFCILNFYMVIHFKKNCFDQIYKFVKLI